MDTLIDYVAAFPSPILSFKHPYYHKFKDDLINYIYDIQSKTPSVHKSNNGGWQSPEHQIIEPFATNIFSQVADAMDLFLEPDYQCQIGNLWFNINPPTASNDRHTHPGCDLAAVYYVKVPDGDPGDIEIENPNHFAQFNILNSITSEVREKSKASHSMWFKPEEGAIVVFPANLTHRVMTNNTSDDRISMSWNMKIVNR